MTTITVNEISANNLTTSELTTSVVTAADNISTVLLDARYARSLPDLDDVNSSITPSNDQVLVWSTGNNRWEVGTQAGAGGGESNTASNVGVSGVGVFKQKTSVDLEFKNINAGSNKISITDDTGSDEIDIDIVDANLVVTASQVSDFDTEVSNNSSVTLNTVKVSNVTHSGDVVGSGVLTIQPGAVDLAMLSASGVASSTTYLRGDNTWSTVSGSGSGETNTASNTGVGGVGVYARKTGVDIELKNINAGSNKVTITDDTTNDEIDIDVVEANINHNALTNTHNLTTSIDHNTITNNHNLTTDIDHNTITNNHNLTTDINHDLLTGFVVNEHIDWSSAGAGTIHTDNYVEGGAGTDTTALHDNVAGEISLVTEKVTPASGDFLIIEDSADTNNKKRVQVGNLPTGGGGEANTASNSGVGGVGVFARKTGIDLELKNLNVGSNKVTITDDVANDEVDIDIVEANINHDSLLNTHNLTTSIDHNTITNNHNLTTDISHDLLTGFVSDEHVAHSGVVLTAGTGLSGGGDISVSRSFSVDLNGLTTELTIAPGDFIAMVDVTDSGSGKITFSTFESTLNHDNLTGFVANEHIDWTIDQGATNINSANYTDTDTTYTAGDGLDLATTTFSLDLKLNGGLVIETTELALDLGASAITGTLAVSDGGTGVTTSTGSGNNVLSTSPTLVTPALGTPASGVLTNCTSLPAAQVSAGTFAGAIEAADHGTAATDQVVNVCYGTSATPPTANTTTEGALYVQYVA